MPTSSSARARTRSFLSAAVGLLLAPALAGAAPSTTPVATCRASSTAAPPTVLELYTSEGCSSCPPADRWLSTLKGRSDVLALAFHVSYWDRLGWPDRFALAEGTARQRLLTQAAGRRQVYTPQVLVNGADWPQWHRQALPAPALSADRPVPAVQLQRQSDQVVATVGGAPSAAPGSRLSGHFAGNFSGYWAVLEDQHQSKVRAGENADQTLRHDHVVRRYQPVAPWPAASGLQAQLGVGPGSAAHPQRVVFVVTDAVTQRPLQAVALGC